MGEKEGGKEKDERTREDGIRHEAGCVLACVKMTVAVHGGGRVTENEKMIMECKEECR